MKLYTYIVKYDYGLAPNPFHGMLTLNVCKPTIRKAANVGDWVIGAGSTSVAINSHENKDFSGKMVYAMKVTRKMTMQEYDCFTTQHLPAKIPFVDKKNWKRVVGDSLYNFSLGKTPALRKALHSEKDRKTDLGGLYTLLSDHFYYFGINAGDIPSEYLCFIKNKRGHKVFEESGLVLSFINWIETSFEMNKLYGDPQLKWKIALGIDGKCKLFCDK